MGFTIAGTDDERERRVPLPCGCEQLDSACPFQIVVTDHTVESPAVESVERGRRVRLDDRRRVERRPEPCRRRPFGDQQNRMLVPRSVGVLDGRTTTSVRLNVSIVLESTESRSATITRYLTGDRQHPDK
ncbi:hypothetical protein HSR121_1519 [Halapricum desulfuricans]|uniref:Uncharacterized protein n=1 Tax=Halapricum desulfuricans TaxID=2841257 RepID=A0A897N016_9EURY|nr:hypothetical protein HSR121_1519 [Halapricum desulfuricans]